MLERYEAKVSRTVLRRGRASNRSFLFGDCEKNLFMLNKAIVIPEYLFQILTVANPSEDISSLYTMNH